MYLFRIHIRPQGGTADMATTFDYCLKNGVLGVGWRTSSQRNTKDWNEYFTEASQTHDNLQQCKYIKKWVSEGDLVWTRDAAGQYYLCQVISGWEYWASPEAIDLDIDIANIFRCEIRPVPIDAVPGKVIACFRATRTMQEIADPRAREYSKYLWNTLSSRQEYKIDKAQYSDIFMMLDDEETEDLVFLYLQSLGWHVLPNSRKADTMSFEYLAINPENGDKALTQVKTGDSTLNRNDYAHLQQKIFLFQSNERYIGDEADNVICLTRFELSSFLSKSLSWLPQAFKNKVALIK